MEITVGLALVLGVVPLIGWWLWWWNDLWYGLPVKLRCFRSGTKLPPGHMGLPFFGEMLTFLWYFKLRRRPDEYINSKRSNYGDGVGLYRTHLFGSPGIITCSPSFIKLVLQSPVDFIVEWPTVDILGTNSLTALKGSTHTRVRGFVTRAINHPDPLRWIAQMMQPGVVAALQSWAQKGRIIAIDETKKVIFENIGKLFASLEPGPVLTHLDELFEDMVKGLRAYPINFPGTTFHHALQCRKKAIAIFRNEMEKKKKNRDSANTTNDLMDGLMQIKDEEGRQLSDMEVLDNIVSLVVAGYESTSHSIIWAIHYLAKYPEVLQKLREENIQLSKNKNGEFITSDDIAKMKYTNKVVEETIRLANISPIMFRKANKDVEYKGYKIPKGWKVYLWVRYLHTNPENFEDPMCFNPDRWNEPPKPGTYQVFGGGVRICAGNMFARLQIAVFLHHLAIGYKWELVNPKAETSYLPHPKPVDGVEIVFGKI
ncbi:ent-kaurenoic acid oxidase-like [Cornus florida]|uniref:ent-kaurenoic acid oxidase-like n=1 Tax=Cornus florida TaxID=4283 RepID=UPI0028A200A3|nr:ent-kaurenoic acid oxidase-like [Cornus florida]